MNMLNYSSLLHAAKVVEGFVVRTPVLESPLLNERLGFRLLIKPECLQRTGSFKLRGAYHTISSLSEAERQKGVVAFSSGNHGQAVACVARHFGIPATVVMPTDAPMMKRANTAAWGAQIITYDRVHENREEIATKILEESQAHLIKPFDDPRIILGQGTAMLEALEDCTLQDKLPHRVFVPCSGAGLLAGSSLAAAEYNVAVTACEPKGYQSVQAAFDAGKPAPAYTDFPTESALCDALLSPTVGTHCYPLIAENVDSAASVTESKVLNAMKFAWEYLKLVVEPGGAASLAVIVQQQKILAGKTVLALLSGGNVDAEVFARAIKTDYS